MPKSTLIFTAGLALGVALPVVLPLSQEQKIQTVRDFPDLGKGLMETPGCLGVQGFTINGGKTQVISAWFKNRKAMEAWYYSKMHQGAMQKFFPAMKKEGKPFAAFKDENAALLIVASVTPSDKPIGQGSNLAVSQIAIEGYTPIPGGLALGGTFSPASLEVPGLVRIPAGL
ncbi:MAG: hypothetical protein ABL962_09270 [Fimbriimonadaceae bacterium]